MTDEQILELAATYCYARTAVGGFIFDRERGDVTAFARALLLAASKVQADHIADERKMVAADLYLWLAGSNDNRFIRAWTDDPARVDSLREAIGLEPARYYAAPAQPCGDAEQADEAMTDAFARLVAFHAEQLDSNPYCYFELAYTRSTAWMAWITDRPAQGEPGTAAHAKSRKVIVRGQGATAEEACADALAALTAPSTGDQS